MKKLINLFWVAGFLAGVTFLLAQPAFAAGDLDSVDSSRDVSVSGDADHHANHEGREAGEVETEDHDMIAETEHESHDADAHESHESESRKSGSDSSETK